MAPTSPTAFTVPCCCLAPGEFEEMLQGIPGHRSGGAAVLLNVRIRSRAWERRNKKMPCGCVSLVGSGPMQPGPPHPLSSGELRNLQRATVLAKAHQMPLKKKSPSYLLLGTFSFHCGGKNKRPEPTSKCSI